ncbi:EF hand [Massilia sp. PDC64]|nr:EF-hand domain-containing protein [Massilia sp. PDC64]SDC36375.1 EF hand [Massilia sp. PDC64]
MVASISSGLSKWADSVFSKLDTKNQGYIEKSDLQSALSGVDGGATQSSDIDDAFGALDGDGDGKVTKSELTEAMTKLSDQLNAQFDAARIQGGGGMRPDGPPPGPPPGGAGGPGGAGSADSTDSTASTSSSTTEPADTNGDGTVSAQEQAAYETRQASESDSGQAAQAHHERDPMREFAHALQLLKAYSDDSDTSSTSSSVSVEA